jgi:L-seryl-tRNA(Ser) seleniumtransferase
MLSLDPKALEKRARRFYLKVLKNTSESLTVTMVQGQSAVGGGSGPNVNPPTTLVALKHSELSAAEIEGELRASSPPVIARIANDLVLLDLRTVEVSEEPELLSAVKAIDH